jgi:hypothetical protein
MKIFNPKYVEAPPFAEGEPFAREAVHKLEREVEGDHSIEGSLDWKETTTSGGGRRGPAKTPPRRRRKTPSKASP